MPSSFRRLFSKDFPAVSSPQTVAYFIGIMVLLGGVLRMVPGHGFTR